MRIAAAARRPRVAFPAMSIDLAIIGAGPAGMAAAVEAADLGLSVAVVDEKPAPGGQVFRSRTGGRRPGAARRLRRGPAADPRLPRRAHRLPPRDHPLAPGAGGGRCCRCWPAAPPTELAAGRVLLATGAQERPVPIPGWTLPGVMTAGAAQTLLKTAGAVPAGRTVLAGQGPLLLLLAAQLIRAGAPPALLLETTPQGRLAGALERRLPAGRGAAAGQGPRAAGGDAPQCRGIRAVTGLRAEGDGRVQRSSGMAAAPSATPCCCMRAWCPRPISRWPSAWRMTGTRAALLAAAGRRLRRQPPQPGSPLPATVPASAAGRRRSPPAGWRRWMRRAGVGRLTAEGFARRAEPLRAPAAPSSRLRPFLDALYAPPDWSWPRRTTPPWSAAARR